MRLVAAAGGGHPLVAQLASDGAVEREHRTRVRRGDAVEAVNGWPTTGQPLEAVLERIRYAGRPLELIVTRPLQHAPPPHTLGAAESDVSAEQSAETRALNAEFERVLKSLLLGFDATTHCFDAAFEEQARVRDGLPRREVALAQGLLVERRGAAVDPALLGISVAEVVLDHA